MRIAVTGSSGQIGSYVAEQVQALGHEAIGVDIRSARLTSLLVDLRDGEAVRAALADADSVIHCAALVNVPRSFEASAEDATTNVIGTINVLEGARRGAAQSIVLVSSCAVYGHTKTAPIPEETPLAPMSPYGAGKAASEAYAKLYRRIHDLPVTVVRPFNVFSERQRPGDGYAGVVPIFINRVREGLPPVVDGGGTQTRDFIHAADVADFLVRVAIQPPADEDAVLNVGSGEERSILDLARTTMRAAGLDGEPVPGPARPAEIERSVADVRKARRLGLRTKNTLDEYVRDALRGSP